MQLTLGVKFAGWLQEDKIDEEETEVLCHTCMLDLADDPQDSMWVDVPVEGVPTMLARAAHGLCKHACWQKAALTSWR